MKTFLKLFLLLALAAYLVFAFARLTSGEDPTECTAVHFVVSDSAHAGFITPAEADRLLVKAGIHPVGRKMDDIDTRAIEDSLKKNPFIKSATCYKAPGGKLNVLIAQRLPVVRIMAQNGEDYYIDENGYTMEKLHYVADIVVATGSIDRRRDRRELVRMGCFLRDNEFWNNQIEQINVSERGEMDLIPRVGSQTIHLGRPDSIARKLHNLRSFYEKVMPEVGWNKYSEINIEHTNQIICKKAK